MSSWRGFFLFLLIISLTFSFFSLDNVRASTPKKSSRVEGSSPSKKAKRSRKKKSRRVFRLNYSRWDTWFELSFFGSLQYSQSKEQFFLSPRLWLGGLFIHDMLLRKQSFSFGLVVELARFQEWGVGGFVEFISHTSGFHIAFEAGNYIKLAPFFLRLSAGWSFLSAECQLLFIDKEKTDWNCGVSLRLPLGMMFRAFLPYRTFSIPQ